MNDQLNLWTSEAPAMNLHDYDLVVINTSGGKDSQTMLRKVVQMAQDQAYPKANMIAVHADLGRVEWQGVRELAEEQVRHYGIAFEAIARGTDLLDHIEAKGKFPGMQTRFCTSDHKRDQINKIAKRIHREEFKSIHANRNKVFKVLNCMGLRAEESNTRSKKNVTEPNVKLTCQSRTATNWHPILDWTEADVWADIKESGVRYHWAYDLGMPRLSCVFCVFAPWAALMIAGEHNPALLNEYVRVEGKIGHTFKNGFAIREVKEALDRGERGGKITGPWCM